MVECFDAVRLFVFFLFFEHYNLMLLCDSVLGHCSVFSFEGVHLTVHSYFIWS